MEDLLTLINIPILQMLGAILLIGLAERIGIPVITFFRSILKLNGNKGIETKMDLLTQHFNEDTTRLLTEINENTKECTEGQRKLCKTLDIILSKQIEMLTYGVPSRKK